MQNIFVGNLSATVTEQALRKLFEPFGDVLSVKIVMDRDSGAPRGFAFVEMNSAEEAKAAIAATNGTVVDDQPLTVNEARQKKPAGTSIRGAMRRHREHRF